MKLKDKIVEYLNETIKTKRSMQKQIESLNEQINKMIENSKERNLQLDFLKNKSRNLQKKLREEHKNYCTLEIELSELKFKYEQELKKNKKKNKNTL